MRYNGRGGGVVPVDEVIDVIEEEDKAQIPVILLPLAQPPKPVEAQSHYEPPRVRPQTRVMFQSSGDWGRRGTGVIYG